MRVPVTPRLLLLVVPPSSIEGPLSRASLKWATTDDFQEHQCHAGWDPSQGLEELSPAVTMPPTRLVGSTFFHAAAATAELAYYSR